MFDSACGLFRSPKRGSRNACCTSTTINAEDCGNLLIKPRTVVEMAHELAGALQQAVRIRQRCAAKEPHVYTRSEYIDDVAEGRISQTCNRTLKPQMRD